MFVSQQLWLTGFEKSLSLSLYLSIYLSRQATTLFAGLIVAWTMRTCSASPLPPAKSCNDPARERLEDLWRTQGKWHESIFQLLGMQNVATTLKDIPKEYVDVKEQALRGPAVCPFGEGSDAELAEYKKQAQGKGSLCPSHDVINYDENRIPSTLFEKKCSCTKCGLGQESDRRQEASSLTESTSLGCHPVIYHVKVLRRVGCGGDDVFIYKAVLEPLVVGCTCDRESRHTNGSPGGSIKMESRQSSSRSKIRVHSPVQK